MKKLMAVLTAVITFIVLFGCSGGGGGGSAPPNNDNNTTTYSIAGTVTSNGSGLSGVTMMLNTTATTTTDSSGNYTISGIANGTCTVTPSKTGYTFSPGSSSITVSSASQTANFIATPVSGSGTFKVPDTGQTTCYDSAGATISCTGTGQDGAYSINPPSYTDNGNGTVTDNVTGLIWQKQNNSLMLDWADANTYCSNNTAGLPGAGWRLPKRMELISILDLGVYEPSINGTYFPNTPVSSQAMSEFWSSTTKIGVGTGSSMWFVSFAWGGTAWDSYIYTSAQHFYRCVLGQVNIPSYTDNGNSTVTENSTGLMWQKQDDGIQRNWVDALSYCNSLSLASYSDWRLPNGKELESLVDESRSNPSIDPVFTNTQSTVYWSSTTQAGSGTAASGRTVHFDDGYSESLSKSSAYYVRCVR